jgi:integrase/recombinase XerD
VPAAITILPDEIENPLPRGDEGLNLQPHDANWPEGFLTIRGAKFNKTRLVPPHPSTQEVLSAYAERRDKIYAPRRNASFFLSSHGTRLNASDVSKVFRNLSKHIGIRDLGMGQWPRLYDFQHRFAVEKLLDWYHNGEQVVPRMPVLSTYQGQEL